MKRIKRKIIPTILGLICFGDTVVAQCDYLCLYSKNQKDSRSWALDEVRKITFSSTHVHVFLWETETSYPFIRIPYEDFRKLTFEAQPLPNGIDEMEEFLESCLKYDAVQKLLFVSGTSKNSRIQLYAYNGILLHSVRLSSEETEYSVEDLPVGIYIVVYTDEERMQSLKIQIK